MRTHRSFLAAVILSLAAAGCALEARAEISVETDYAGQYVRTVVVTSASTKSVRIWSLEGTRYSRNSLNPGGDPDGDLWPVIAENPYDSRHPWVVWSRDSGAGYDLAWARWMPEGWTAPAWVEEPASAAAGDDLDPRIAFDLLGQPWLVWWRNERGTGRVYVSMYLDGEWTPADRVSDAGVDSRSPVIRVLADGRIQVGFETPRGHVIRFVFAVLPQSITDDIDPITPKGVVPPSNATQRSDPTR